MTGMREEFYAALQTDFQNNGADCFLCRYWRQFPRSQGAWARLREAFQRAEQGEAAPWEYLCVLLDLLAQNDKFHLSRPARERLWELGRQMGGAQLFAGMGRDTQRCRALAGLLRQRRPALPWETLNQIHQQAAQAILKAEARNFLYDGTHRKKDRTLDMLNAYCRENGLALRPPARGGGLTPEERWEIEALFQLLRTGRNTHVLIPLQLDARTGAGLYIVGKAYFREMRSICREMKGACCYACFCWNDLNISEDCGVSLSWAADEEELAGLCNFPTLDEALRWYDLSVRSNALEFLREKNGAPPPGCPPGLRHYFSAPSPAMPGPEEICRAREEMERDAQTFRPRRRRSPAARSGR